ncbi:PQQ-like beta-propeller repeat protein [Ruegeria marina]|uniref:Outer membrane protein assembly factor BamB, contains PQQ-like beta-propeller repeat n=1 Tax=Ruegeria marina TaxID=639004 RepID=A0A1G6QL41_9RHOB|nr:PQQ-like beta-propeller repeat protein [Ruegeria marina]SDC92941.1 Outer membrane protein assembly factor BamB, contains PQQ-like beta-propeller repeat [Ruegeria marina]
MVTSSFSRFGAALVGSALLLLAGCEEPEVILPGVREDIRPMTEAEQLNQSRPIRLAAQQSNAEWPQGFGTPAYRTAHPALRASPQLVWSVPIGSGDSRRQRITADPVVAGGLVYTLDSAERVSAVTPGGGLVWQTDLIPPGESEGQATGGGMGYADGVLYVSSGFGNLTALDARTGNVRWRQKLNATGSGAPTIRDGLIYLVAGDDTAWAVTARDGRIAWQFQATPSVGNVLGAPAPALSNDLAIFAFGSGDLVGAFRKGGVRRWGASVSGERKGRAAARIGDVTGSPVIVGSTLYAGNHSGRTVAFRADNGERLWTATEGALGPVWPAGDSIFLVSDRNQIIRMNAADGSVIWAQDLPGFVKDKPKKRGATYAHYGPILAGGRVIVASNDGYLRLYNPEDGTLLQRIEVPGGATTGPVVAGNTLYVVGTKGQLHAFR